MYSTATVRRFFEMNVDRLDPTQLDITPYHLFIADVLPVLCSASIITSIFIILDAVADYPRTVCNTPDANFQARQYWMGTHPSWDLKVMDFLNHFERNVFIVLKQSAYDRFHMPNEPTNLEDVRDRATARRVIDRAITLPYNPAVAFLAALAGAWILSYPESSILQSPQRISYFGQRNTTNEDLSFMLSSLLIEHGTGWMRK